MLPTTQAPSPSPSASPRSYICWDRNEPGCQLQIWASSPDEAAAEYVGSGDWGSYEQTIWIDVLVRPEIAGDDSDDDLRITIAIDPPAPRCARGHEHHWCSPHSVVGGDRKNPGVRGSCAGVVIEEICAHCGTYRVTDTWATRRDTGESGLDSVSYRDADEISRQWSLTGSQKVRAEKAAEDLGCIDAGRAAAAILYAYEQEECHLVNIPARAQVVIDFLNAVADRHPYTRRARDAALRLAIGQGRSEGGMSARVAEYVSQQVRG